MAMITKATRITNHTLTLVDHIYTNMPQKYNKSGDMIDGYYTDHVYQFFCILVVASFGGGGRMVRD